MKINKHETIIAFDCDETLVLHTPLGRIILDYYGIPKAVNIHQEHVDLLKSYKARGFYIRVWSNNGWKWAAEVVRGLGIENYVDEIETKTSKYIDDHEHANKVLGQHIYIKP